MRHCHRTYQNPNGGCAPSSFSKAASDVDGRDECCWGANATAEARKRERAAQVFMVVAVETAVRKAIHGMLSLQFKVGVSSSKSEEHYLTKGDTL